MKSTVVDESLSSFKPMYCSREYQASTKNVLLLKVLNILVAIQGMIMKMFTVSHSFINLLVILLSFFSYENY